MATDRRSGERRRSWISLRYPDRRLGFRRRLPAGPIARRYHATLTSMRDRTLTIALLVSLLFALNLADLILTRRALAAGAIEANPIMAALFEAGLAVPAKLGLTALAIATLWALRRYRIALAALVWACVGFGALVTYQVALLAVL